jgi:acetyl-CoA C-acetyltransferase
MMYEVYLQLLGRADERQLQTEPQLGLTHNLGGYPSSNVSSVAILGRFAG